MSRGRLTFRPFILVLALWLVACGASPTVAVDLDEELRSELLTMLELDQSIRGSESPDDDVDFDAADRENQARLGEIFDTHGWPGWSLVGEDGSTAAWAIVQHADLNPPFQERGLELLQEAVENGDASAGDLAYLTDRVLVSQGEPQIYGTQWQIGVDGEWEPRTPIEDETSVDERRAEAGLGTLDEYLEELKTAFP